MRRFFISSLVLVCLAAVGLYLYSLYVAPRIAAPDIVTTSTQADAIIVEKAKREMVLMKDGAILARYKIRLGFAPVGTKERRGDGKTPEGTYRIDRRNKHSAYHLSLGINYPTPAERKAAGQKGIDPGDNIFIHGQPNQMGELPALPYDWTAGCIAVSNREIRQIWSMVSIGTPVTIRP